MIEILLFMAVMAALLSFLWLVSLAFQTSAGWGLLVLLCPPLALVFAARHGRVSREPLLLFGVSGILAGVAAWRSGVALQWLDAVRSQVPFDTTAIYLLGAALVILLIAWIWLIIRAGQVHTGWGLATLLLAPIGVPAFVLACWRRARAPFFLGLLGLLLAGAAFGLTHYSQRVDLGPYETVENGQRHLTLTGWDRDDYSLLANQKDLVVLQMANPDVTDATLQLLKGMDRLEELDLGGTKITDDGLSILAQLPDLRVLRIPDTAISDAGFDRHLAPLKSLRQLDVRHTAITSQAIQKWKDAGESRRAMQ